MLVFIQLFAFFKACSSIGIVSEDPNCGIPHDDSRGVIYDCSVFIVLATGFELAKKVCEYHPRHLDFLLRH